MRLALILCVCAPLVARAQTQPTLSSADAWLPRTTGDLVVLDKVRARPTTVTLTTGKTATAGPLAITLIRCVTRPADVPANSAAFVEIRDSRSPATFRGWMLVNEPSLGQLEHPIYDVRLIACR